MGDMSPLKALLANLESLVVVDDAAAAERDRVVAEGQRYEARIRRQEVLRREDVPIDAATESAILDGGERLKPTRALTSVRGWLARHDVAPVLVLSGGTGTGKSIAAAHALAESRAGLWRTAAQLCRTFSASFGDQFEDQELCLTCALLIADDVGCELGQHRERMGATLVELLEHRKRSPRYMRTIITTNLNKRDFVGRYGTERLVSRMARTAGIVEWIETADADMRRAK